MPDDPWKLFLESLKPWAWVALFLAGVAVLGIALAIWLLPQQTPTKTVKETSSVSVTSSGSTTPATPGATGAQGATGARGATGASEAAPSNSETVSSKSSTTTGPDKDPRSDTLLVALLGIGAGLILAGAFFDRISSLKFAGIELSLQAKVAEKLAGITTPTTPEEREKTRATYLLALSNLPPGTSPGDDPVIDAAVWNAASTVGVPTSSGDDPDDSPIINPDFE